MIDYNVEFTKGVLFVRLYGILNSFTEKEVKDDIYEIIKEGGIRNLVINIEDVEKEDDIILFDELNELIRENDGRMIICGNKFLDFEYSSNELSALKEFSV